MRRLFNFSILLLITFVWMQPARSQNQPEAVGGIQAKSYPIPGSMLLWQKEQKVRDYVREHPDAMQSPMLQKREAWGFTVGSTHQWYADNFTNDARYLVSSTCRAVGTNCYVFVEDSVWGTRVTQAVVDSIQHAFDLRTPTNGSKGIYQMDVDAFGNPPNVDADPKIIILILNIIDGYSGTGGYVAGYFYGFNEISPSQPGYSTSNYAEIYFLDCNPASLGTPTGLFDAMGTTAHEFQHMIHFNYDPGEIAFVNESCSLVAEVICGYGIYGQSGFASEPNHYLLDWRSGDMVNVLKDYSRAARFSTYFKDQFGNAVFKPIVASTLHGVAGVDAGLTTFGTTRRFNDIFADWAIANILDDTTVNKKYGYKYPGLPKVVGTTYTSPTVSLMQDTVRRQAADYISFLAGSDLRATFTWSNSNVTVRAVEISSGGSRVVSLTSGVEFHELGFGTTYSKIHFVVTNIDPTNDAIFSYVASGGSGVTTTDLAYAGSAAYYTPLTGDPAASNKKFAVRYSPATSGFLYSVSVAFNSGTRGVNGTGSLRVAAAQNVSGSIGGIPGSQIGSSVTVPFSSLTAGYYNTIDMSAQGVNISSGTDFQIVFDIVGATTDTLQFLLDNGTTNPTNRTSSYRNGVNGLNWYNRADPNYLSGRAPTYENLLATATVATLTDVENTKPDALPAVYSLGQNYPNPFNPATTIEYQLPASGLVTLKVYDLVGREVATLVNQQEAAGVHQAVWNAGMAPSGVYFYRLTAGKFTETKKLVLLK